MPCFTPGTLIATPAGPRPVELLEAGDEIVTADGAVEQVAWVGRRRLPHLRAHPTQHAVQPVLVVAGAFGPGAPQRDLVLSPGHAVAASERLVPIGRLINGRTIVQLERDAVEYLHVELRRHDLLLAEGLAVESYLDCGNRADFQGDDALNLHPQFAALAHEAACLPLLLHGPELEQVRRHLAQRADELERRPDSARLIFSLAATLKRVGLR